MRGRLFGPKRLLRVDLHGVSEFGGGEEHTLLRWEWVEAIEIERGSVVVRGGDEAIVLPSGAFGLAAEALAEELQEAMGIRNRSEVIARLSGGGAQGDGGAR